MPSPLRCGSRAGIAVAPHLRPPPPGPDRRGRVTDRRHELGVRLALGAGRARLVRALIVESLSLAVVGAALGILPRAVGPVSLVVPQFAVPGLQGIAPALSVTLDARLVLVAFGLALVSGTLPGLVPAWRAAKVRPRNARHGGRTGRAVAGARHRRDADDSVIRAALLLAVAVGGVTIAALAASYLPARRASRIDPLAALREE